MENKPTGFCSSDAKNGGFGRSHVEFYKAKNNNFEKADANNEINVNSSKEFSRPTPSQTDDLNSFPVQRITDYFNTFSNRDELDFDCCSETPKQTNDFSSSRTYTTTENNSSSGRNEGFCDVKSVSSRRFEDGGPSGGGFDNESSSNFSQRPSSAFRQFSTKSNGKSTEFPAPPFGGFQQNKNEFNNDFNWPINHGFTPTPELTNFENNKPRQLPSNFIPVLRDVEELYKEDAEHAENYRYVADDDDEIHLSGPNIERYAILETWNASGFDPKLLANIIDRSKYIRPRKIQSHVIPIVLEGRDVKGHAETGSGKTAAFMLPIIHMLMNSEFHSRQELGLPSPRAIIIEPTRELCNQIYEQGRKLANETCVSVAKAYGQYSMRENLSELQAGCDILCATPGRLKHLIQSNLITVEHLKFFVLDEADTLLESNFLKDIRELINSPNFPNKQNRQTMLFSATFPELVQKLSMNVLKEDCVMVSNRKMVAANSKVLQSFVSVRGCDKKQALLEILQSEINLAKKNNSNNPELRRTLVFVQAKRDADLVSLYLCEKGIRATTINGDRPQNLREKALRDFRNNNVNVLVSTDVCARGIDIKDLDHVINMDLPIDAVTYVHRIGRTGRLKHGQATSFFDELNDYSIAKKLVQFVKDVGQEAPDFLIDAAGKSNNFDNEFSQAFSTNDNVW